MKLLWAGNDQTQDYQPDSETKLLALDEIVEAVRMAVWRCLNCDEPQSDIRHPVAIYADHVIIRVGMAFYRADYTIEPEGVMLAPKDQWIQVEQEWAPTLAVKALGDGRIGGYAVIYGSPDQPDLSSARDFFTKSTDFWLDKWSQRPIIYHHAMDDATADAPVVGLWDKALQDDIGIWLEGQLDQAHQYRAAITKLVEAGALALSSDSAPHLVKRKKAAKGTHEVTRWPLLAASLTPTPAEPRLLPVEQIKSAFKAAGIDLPADWFADGEGSIGISTGAKAQEGERARRLRLQLDILSLE